MVQRSVSNNCPRHSLMPKYKVKMTIQFIILQSNLSSRPPVFKDHPCRPPNLYYDHNFFNPLSTFDCVSQH